LCPKIIKTLKSINFVLSGLAVSGFIQSGFIRFLNKTQVPGKRHNQVLIDLFIAVILITRVWHSILPLPQWPGA
jgi:hypothetical protein